MLAVQVLTGCVCKSRFVVASRQLERAQEQNAALTAEKERLKEALSRLQSDYARTQESLSEARGRLEAAVKASALADALLNEYEAQVAEANDRLDDIQAVLKNAGVDDEEAAANLIRKLKTDLATAQSNQAELQKQIDALTKKVEKFTKLAEMPGINVRFDERGRLVLDVQGDLLFASNSAKLSDSSHSTIEAIATVMRTEKDQVFDIEGHTDTRPIQGGVFSENFELGFGRAMSVRKALVAAGVPDRNLSATSWGSIHPVCREDSASCHASNRRVAIIANVNLKAVFRP